MFFFFLLLASYKKKTYDNFYFGPAEKFTESHTKPVPLIWALPPESPTDVLQFKMATTSSKCRSITFNYWNNYP